MNKSGFVFGSLATLRATETCKTAQSGWGVTDRPLEAAGLGESLSAENQQPVEELRYRPPHKREGRSAIAHKTARALWAMMTRAETYHRSAHVTAAA